MSIVKYAQYFPTIPYWTKNYKRAPQLNGMRIKTPSFVA